MSKFIVRDVALLAITVTLFFIDPVSQPMQVALGLLLGLCAYLFHEWAHYVGALVSRSNVRLGQAIWSPFLFSFDSNSNSVQQFWHMTWPGFAATACYLICYIHWFDSARTADQVAVTLALALATLTVVIEGPIALWVLIKGVIPAVEIPLIGDNKVLNELIQKFRNF